VSVVHRDRAGRGLPTALDSGLVGDRIGAVWAQRSARLAHRQEPITGVSEFANPAETLPVRRSAPQEAAPRLYALPRVRAAVRALRIPTMAPRVLTCIRRARSVVRLTHTF
jgi:methylmalonyl-CoA mutase N-terminal domain/subunit